MSDNLFFFHSKETVEPYEILKKMQIIQSCLRSAPLIVTQLPFLFLFFIITISLHQNFLVVPLSHAFTNWFLSFHLEQTPTLSDKFFELMP